MLQIIQGGSAVDCKQVHIQGTALRFADEGYLVQDGTTEAKRSTEEDAVMVAASILDRAHRTGLTLTALSVGGRAFIFPPSELPVIVVTGTSNHPLIEE